MAKKNRNQADLTKNVTKVMDRVEKFHDGLINTSEELIEGSVNTGLKWHKLWSKALKNSEPLIARQVEMVFDTLEGIKDQVEYGRNRVSKLVSDKAVSKKSPQTTAKTKSAPIRKTSVSQVKVDASKKIRKSAPKAKTAQVKTITDLKLVNGIGPKVEELLNSAGIKSVNDLAVASEKKIKTVLENAGSRYRLLNPAPWKKEAKLLLNKSA